MRDRILENMKKYLEGRVTHQKMNIENLLENPEVGGHAIVEILDERLEHLALEQSKLENLALFTEY